MLNGKDLLNRTKTPEFAQFNLKPEHYDMIKKFSTRKNTCTEFEKDERYFFEKDKVRNLIVS